VRKSELTREKQRLLWEGVSFENLFEGFSTEERHFLNRVLEENKLIPQEIIPYTVLSER